MTGSAATILIVDDEIQNRKLLEALLRPEGYLTLGAANGEDALASVAKCPPDLILLDIMMPSMNGYQLAGTLKANAATSNIPIIMVTARVDRSARLAGLNAGVEEFLTTPVDRAELWLRVRNLLRLKALGDDLRKHSSMLEQLVQARTASLAAINEQLRDEMRRRQTVEIELRLAQKLEAVGRLAAGISHEVNTPIQYISDSAHFLRSAFAHLLGTTASVDPTEPALRDADSHFLRKEIPRSVERIIEGTQRVAAIVRAMKDFSHPGTGEKIVSDLNRALEATLLIAQSEYKYVATVDLQCGDIPEIMCNVGELSQVFLNLIVNAAHALADAGRDSATGRIRIRTQLVDGWVELNFDDNGCGIAEEIIAKIYDPFFTTKEVGRGSGQGLAIARVIVVDKHAGYIGVVSTPNVGTCFTLRLPVGGPAAAIP
ncbi:MAG TPA: response regulator [Steroidobacteraceae bacterium]|jgi:two-component system, NtrC family, sensor kinase|nr:response regulator [Steroidobacteraceae bacterium]